MDGWMDDWILNLNYICFIFLFKSSCSIISVIISNNDKCGCLGWIFINRLLNTEKLKATAYNIHIQNMYRYIVQLLLSLRKWSYSIKNGCNFKMVNEMFVLNSVHFNHILIASFRIHCGGVRRQNYLWTRLYIEYNYNSSSKLKEKIKEDCIGLRQCSSSSRIVPLVLCIQVSVSCLPKKTQKNVTFPFNPPRYPKTFFLNKSTCML